MANFGTQPINQLQQRLTQNPNPINNTITYQLANSQVQNAFKNNNSPIETIASLVENFFNGETESSVFDLSRFKAFMYRVAAENFVVTQLGGNYNAVQLDPSVGWYEPRYVIKKTEVVKEENPNFKKPSNSNEQQSSSTEISELKSQISELTKMVQAQQFINAPPAPVAPIAQVTKLKKNSEAVVEAAE